MQKVKKVANVFNPFKGGKPNYFLIAIYVGTAGLLVLWKLGIIDEELYHALIAFLQSLPFGN